MSVAIAKASDPMAFDISDPNGASEDIDWGTATPVNTIAEVISDKKLDKAISRCALQATPLPRHQKALILHELRKPFSLTGDHLVPQTRKPDELVVKIQAIGLNPIDWKSVDYGYGIPVIPYVPGRDFAGVVVKAPSEESHIQVGDVVLCGSTDYRDLRKAAYQEYAIATHYTVCRLPAHTFVAQGAALGVAYVAATLALGVSLGLRLPKIESAKGPDGPDLRALVRRQPLQNLPADTVPEILAIEDHEIPQPGDWIVIWGGSSTSALFLSQIARLAGLRVILVVDVAKHGARMVESNGFTFVDSHSTERASQIIRGVTGDKLRYGIDTVGKQTSEALAKCLQIGGEKRSHLVGLAALPKERIPGIVYHSVPIKLAHEVPEVGRSLNAWLELALQTRALNLPAVEQVCGGLEGINAALDRMRQGQISGKRLVVPL